MCASGRGLGHTEIVTNITSIRAPNFDIICDFLDKLLLKILKEKPFCRIVYELCIFKSGISNVNFTCIRSKTYSNAYSFF